VNFDDPVYVVDNPHVRTGLSLANFAWAMTSTEAANWHPLTWLSLQLDAQLYGLQPFGFHLTNVVLHSINACLLFIALRAMTGAAGRSAVVAALFAWHPLHVESVAWITARKDVLSTLFWMLTLIAYGAYARRPTWSRYGCIVLFFGLGLLAKPMLVSLPAVLCLLDYWPLDRLKGASWRSLVSEKVPLFVLAVGSSIITLFAQHQGEALYALDDLSLPSRVESALVSYAVYVGKMFWPRALAAFYAHPGTTSRLPAAIAASVLFIATSVAAFRFRRRAPYLMTGWWWYVVTLVPVIGLVQVGSQGLADRYTYVPLIGLSIMLVWGGNDLCERLGIPKLASVEAMMIGLGVCAWLSLVQIGYWRDSATLWQHAIEVSPDAGPARFGLGDALQQKGELDNAIQQYAEASRLSPRLPRVHGNWGIALAQQGRLDEAIRHYRAEIRLRPRARMVHYNLGLALAGKDQLEEASREYNEELTVNPQNALAHNNLGLIFARLGKLDEAVAEYHQALAIDPNLALAHYNLGLALTRQKRFDEAKRHQAIALRLDPNLRK
jgi:Flp pilus assembly protein TadD